MIFEVLRRRRRNPVLCYNISPLSGVVQKDRQRSGIRPVASSDIRITFSTQLDAEPADGSIITFAYTLDSEPLPNSL